MKTRQTTLALLLIACSHLAAAQTIDAGALIPQAPAEMRLTMKQALEIGSRTSPLLTAAAYQVKSASSNLSAQRAPLNPTLAFAGVNNTVSSLNFANSENYTVAATIETSGRQALRTRVARAGLDQARADSDTTRLNVFQAVSAAYIDLQGANAAFAVERDVYKLTADLYDLTRKQLSLGAAPETNEIRARIALTQEEQNLLNAANAVSLARANLNVQMGRPPDTPVDTAEPLTYAPVHYRIKDLQAAALRARPEIQSAEANARQLQAIVGQQRAQWYPDVMLQTTVKADQLFAGVTVPLLDFGQIRGSVHKAQADLKSQQAQTEQERRQVELDVANAFLTLENSRKLVDTYHDGIVPRSASLLDRIEQGYKLGNNTILDLIDAQQTDRSTRRAYEGAIHDFRQAEVQLERSIGGTLPPAVEVNSK